MHDYGVIILVSNPNIDLFFILRVSFNLIYMVWLNFKSYLPLLIGQVLHFCDTKLSVLNLDDKFKMSKKYE